jgi:hypothetical protein
MSALAHAAGSTSCGVTMRVVETHETKASVASPWDWALSCYTAVARAKST